MLPSGTYATTGANRAQVVRVPNYDILAITATGSLTTAPWDGTRGGVIAVRAKTSITIDAGGSIDLSGKGFTGGPGGAG